MIYIAIVEDDEIYRREIQEHLRRYEEEKHVPLRIDIFVDGRQIVERYPADYDILLMDIDLPQMDGMSAAERIRDVDSEVAIIFITNFPQYAICGYHVEASDYLLKPVNYAAFSRVLDKIVGRKQKKKQYLMVNEKSGKQKLEIKKIRFVEVRNHVLTFHMTDGDFTAKGAIRDVEEELRGESFFRCNKGYLVNLAYVDRVSGYDVWVGKDMITVGHTHKKEFLDALNQFIN